MFDINSYISKHYNNVVGYAHNFGLQHADCLDVCQDIFAEFNRRLLRGEITCFEKVDAFLWQLVRWRVTDKLRGNSMRTRDISTVGLENNLDELPSEKQTSLGWKMEIVNRAYNEVKKNKIQRKARHKEKSISDRDCEIFHMAVFQRKTAPEIAKLLDTNVPTVHLAKHRVGKRVILAAKELVKKFE